MTVPSDRPTDAPPRGGDAADAAARVIRRMDRRSTIWAWASMILWLLVAGGVVAYAWFYVTYVNPLLQALPHYVDDVAKHEEFVRRFSLVLPTIARITVTSACVWAGLVALAATCTLLYVRASRRATLQQIHAGLADISQQLKALAG